MARQKLTHAYYGFASYVRREGHLKEVFLLLAKSRLILDEMCRLYGKFASYLRRALCKKRLIFPRINGPNDSPGLVLLLLLKYDSTLSHPKKIN